MKIDCAYSPHEHCGHPDVIQLQAEHDELVRLLSPLANARKAKWAEADSSTPPYVVSESAVMNARQVTRKETEDGTN